MTVHELSRRHHRPQSRVLRADAIHQDVPFGETMTAAVNDEINDLARWLELELALPVH